MSPAQPSDREPLSVACELVGRFQHHFARIDQGMDEAITKVFDLDDGAAAILLANIDFMKKVDILRSVIALQFSVADKEAADRLLKKIKGINNPDRQTVIHSTFEPHGTDSVKFRRVTAKGKLSIQEPIWTKADFERRCAEMDGLATELAALITKLKRYRPSLDFSDPRNSGYVAVLFDDL
jgi:hypothetical protein